MQITTPAIEKGDLPATNLAMLCSGSAGWRAGTERLTRPRFPICEARSMERRPLSTSAGNSCLATSRFPEIASLSFYLLVPTYLRPVLFAPIQSEGLVEPRPLLALMPEAQLIPG